MKKKLKSIYNFEAHIIDCKNYVGGTNGSNFSTSESTEVPDGTPFEDDYHSDVTTHYWSECGSHTGSSTKCCKVNGG